MSARNQQATAAKPVRARRSALGQTSQSGSLTDSEILAREANRLAALAAEFAAFGMRIDTLDESAWSLSADASYRTDAAPAAAPANDAAPRPSFPQIERRGVHLSRALPSKGLQALDWLFVLVVAELSARWSEGAGLGALEFSHAAAFVASALTLKLGLWITEAYALNLANMRPERSMGGLALGAIAGLFTANFIAPDARSAAALATILPVSAMVMAGIHAALAVWIAAAHRAGVFAENIVLVGATNAARRLATRLQRTGEARVLAVVDDRRPRQSRRAVGVPVAGPLCDLLNWQGLPHVDRIVVALPPAAESRVRGVIGSLRALPNRVDILLDYETLGVRGAGFERFGGAAVACVSGRPHNHRRAMAKRAQDIVAGLVLLAAFALPMIIIAAAIKLDSKGPVLFRQRRHGFNNRVFTMLKFRSMRCESADLPSGRTQERVTRVGAFLRRTSLDELPQLFNVLMGDMSLVGPRPHEPDKTAGERPYKDVVAEYAHRHRVKPGITGWAQVNGCRGAVKSPAALRRRLRHDLDYIAQTSLWFDLQILLRTAAIVAESLRPRR